MMCAGFSIPRVQVRSDLVAENNIIPFFKTPVMHWRFEKKETLDKTKKRR